MTELKPCPFCGSSDIQQEYNGPHGYEPYVVCVDCGCCVDGKFGAWNTRAAIEAPVQEPVAWRWRLCYREEWCWSVSKPMFSTHDLEQGTVFDVHPLYTAPQTDETAALRAKLAEVERAAYERGAEAGWNAARTSVYGICEAIEDRANTDLEKPQVSEYGAGYLQAEKSTAKHIRRAMGSFEAKDDDNFLALLTQEGR